MSFPTSLRHQQKAELYNAASYLDACDEKRIAPEHIDPAYYRTCAQVCRLRLEESLHPERDFSDLFRHSEAINTIAKNLEYEQAFMHFRGELYPDLDRLMSRFEGQRSSGLPR